MKIVVTGGIGTGKSTVCKLLQEKLGADKFRYYSFDEWVRCYYMHPLICDHLIKRFGTCDRKELSKLAFDNPKVLLELEQIFALKLRSEIVNMLGQGHDVIFEFPLLLEKGEEFIDQFDYVITVSAPKELQLARVQERDGKSREAVQSIIDIQTSDEERFAISDFVIHNVQSLEIEEQIAHKVQHVVDQIKRKQVKGRIGIVSGSFDPITLGHAWVIQRALDVVDHVVVALAHNRSKKYLLDQETREQLVRETILEVLTPEQQARVTVDFVPTGELTVTYAKSVGAKFIFRGLRNATDLEYENQLNLFQKKMAPDVETIYFLTPREYIEISSSFIKGSLDLREWEHAAEPYVPKCVLEKLRELKNKPAPRAPGPIPPPRPRPGSEVG